MACSRCEKDGILDKVGDQSLCQNCQYELRHGYVAGFQGRQIEIYALSLYAAKQKALAEFKPSKKNAGLVWVMLAEKDGEQVTHTGVNVAFENIRRTNRQMVREISTRLASIRKEINA